MIDRTVELARLLKQAEHNFNMTDEDQNEDAERAMERAERHFVRSIPQSREGVLALLEFAEDWSEMDPAPRRAIESAMEGVRRLLMPEGSSAAA